ncbi:MAG TPA: phosphatase PAP2 family protein [Polyangiaceae bacterium]
MIALISALDLRALLALYGGAEGAWAVPMLVLTVVFSGWLSLALVPLLWLGRTRRFALPLALGVAAQAVLVWAIKAAVGRVRPWIALGLPAPIGAPHDGSFPSGHAAGNFCVAAFLALALPAAWPDARGRARLVAVVAVGLAALVAVSRVYLGAHFPSDVVCGAALGALVGALAGKVYALRAVGVERAPKRS